MSLVVLVHFATTMLVVICPIIGSLVSFLYTAISGSEDRRCDVAITYALASVVACTLILSDQQSLCLESFGASMAESNLSVLRELSDAIQRKDKIRWSFAFSAWQAWYGLFPAFCFTR